MPLDPLMLLPKLATRSAVQLAIRCLFFSFFILPTTAQADPFTILAPKGLILRAGPGQQHPKLTTLPFGTIVEANLTEAQLQYFEAIPPFDAQVIEGHRGFWMPVRYQQHRGFLFSGFVQVGERVVKSTEQNRDFRMLVTGYSCDMLNYDPQLHWYKMAWVDGALQFVPTQVSLRLRQAFTLRDTVHPYWEGLNYEVLHDGSGEEDLLIGSRQPLPARAALSKMPGTQRGDAWEPCFLDAGQTYTVNFNGGRYRFFVEALQAGDSAARPANYRFKVGVRLPGEAQERTIPLSKELGLDESLETYRHFRTPTLHWVGDLNGDGYLDFIWCWRATLESCGGGDAYHLLFTDPEHPKRLIWKVAYEYHDYCT